MIFKDLPEFVNEESVYQTVSFNTTIEKKLELIERDFKTCYEAMLFDKLNVLRFWMGDMLMFSYRDDGVKLIAVYESPERYAVVIYDKAIYDFVVKQGIENEDEDYIVPKLDKAKFAPMKYELKETYLSSLPHRVFCDMVSD